MSPSYQYIFVVEPFGFEVQVQAKSSKEAHKLAWESLTDEQKDNCEYLECVDTDEV